MMKICLESLLRAVLPAKRFIDFSPKLVILVIQPFDYGGIIMLAVRLTKELEDELTKLAASSGRSKSYYVKEALTSYLQDHSDPL